MKFFFGFLVFISTCLLVSAWEPRQFDCATDAYPPPDNNSLPVIKVDLSAAPIDRWVSAATTYRQEIHDLLSIMKLMFGKYAPEVMLLIEKEFAPLLKRMPAEYAQEMQGVARGSMLDIGDVVLYNIFYELFTFCTSIVAQDTQGNVFHGRNLDFGLLPAYNFSAHEWDLTTLLRPLTVSVDFVQDGALLYRSVHFVGYVGILSAMRPGGYAVTVDDRFDDSFDAGLIQWIKNPSDPAQFFGLVLRNLFASTASYDAAIPVLQDTQLISPIYFIVSGAATAEGAVVTREKNVTLSIATLQSQLDVGTFYLVETNYDHYYNDAPAPWYDQRRYAAMQCLNATTASGLDWSSLYNVLYTKPVRNQLTTYTILMSAQTGHWQVWHQFCQDLPCALW